MTLTITSGASVFNDSGDPAIEIFGGHAAITGTLNIDTGAVVSVTSTSGFGTEEGLFFDGVGNLTLNINGTSPVTFQFEYRWDASRRNRNESS